MCAQKVSQPTGKICFVIAPVGDTGSAVRTRSDQVFKYIIAPAATACGYEPLRADKIPKPGIITSQVIQHLIDDHLVIADLTGPNANVFYELAVRHAFRKPVVQIIDAAQSIPFDLAASRTIRFNYPDLEGAEQARDEIKRQIKAVEENPEEVDNPLTQAVEFQSLSRSGNPLEKSAAEIIAMLQDLKTGLNEILENIKRQSQVEAFWGKGKAALDVIPYLRLADAAFKLDVQTPESRTPPKTGKDKKGK
jgi:hypothetical protein